MEKSKVDLFISNLNASLSYESGMSQVDLTTICNSTMDAVSTFCTSNNLTRVENISQNNQIFMANESYDADAALSTITSNDIVTLVESCGIRDHRKGSACAAIVNVMNKYYNSPKNGSFLFSNHNKNVKDFGYNTKVMSLEELFPSDLATMLNTQVQSEDFGAGISKVLPDLRMAITITIMQFHQGITARLVPVRVATEPVIQYKREDYKIYNVADPESMDKDLIELCKNPKPVTNEAIKIIPLKANDSATEPALVRDGVIRFSAEANILKLAIDDTKYGHNRINRTDLVAEGPELDKIYFSITNAGTTEEFEVAAPYALRRLIMENNALHSAMRSANVTFNIFLNKDSKQSNGTVSALLAGFSADEGLNVAFTVKPAISLRDGSLKALGDIKATAYHTTDIALISAGFTTFFGATTVALVGYSMDARYDEQNIRKSQIATRIQTRQMVQVIPPCKNYIVETAIGQPEEDNGASHVVQVIKIGQDDKTLTTIERIMGYVFDMSKQMNANPLQKGIDPGHHYVAGSLVRPRVTMFNLDVQQVISMKDSDRASDLRCAVQIKINKLVEDLLMDTMYTQQLPAGQAPTFRVATSRVILNTLFAVPHIHNHLDNHVSPSNDGVEFRRVLDSGVVLEFVTSLFDYMEDTIIMIPIIPGAPDSILNWGHNWDHGTVIGNYNHSMDTAAWNRMFASVREITLPTNPMGMLIKVTNIDKAVRLV